MYSIAFQRWYCSSVRRGETRQSLQGPAGEVLQVSREASIYIAFAGTDEIHIRSCFFVFWGQLTHPIVRVTLASYILLYSLTYKAFHDIIRMNFQGKGYPAVPDAGRSPAMAPCMNGKGRSEIRQKPLRACWRGISGSNYMRFLLRILLFPFLLLRRIIIRIALLRKPKVQRKEGPTVHGGAYAIVIHDGNRVEVTEFDENDHPIYRTYSRLM